MGDFNDKGSPPPMRGKAVRTRFFQLGEGITPAYAGKRVAVWTGQRQWKDHPRLCGEKSAFHFALISAVGSPPPMRGKAPIFFASSVIDKDHPRLCGEKAAVSFFFRSSPGSPPPMRGKALRLLYHRGEFLGSPPPMRGKVPDTLHKIL